MRFELGRPAADLRVAEEARIDAEAHAAAEAVRPAISTRMDAARLEQARTAALLADDYASTVPLIAAVQLSGTLAQKAAAVLAAAADTNRRLTIIETARLAAKARLRAAVTPAEMRLVRLEISVD
ncbi:hypothetical protein EOD42_14190 [Rhodovarius crocodyli]|uniref:Uncharacterized protein n=1 Tax=Rhodovarius crocodyli TaxID=1979269 RepID=A0A437MF24_9PROT|nr:hypothetical protein [Rhodovarius crocodyli]RVT96258.1 hypothetical protein EOD42_14190 [Rhodovarius crocodyli]